MIARMHASACMAHPAARLTTPSFPAGAHCRLGASNGRAAAPSPPPPLTLPRRSSLQAGGLKWAYRRTEPDTAKATPGQVSKLPVLLLHGLGSTSYCYRCVGDLDQTLAP